MYIYIQGNFGYRRIVLQNVHIVHWSALLHKPQNQSLTKMDDGQRRRKVRNNIALEKLKSCAGLKINQGHDLSFVNIIFHFWTNTFVPLETLRRARLYLLKASQLCHCRLQLKNPMFFLTPPNKHNFSLPSNLISLSCHCRCDASHFSSNQAVIKLLKLFSQPALADHLLVW